MRRIAIAAVLGTLVAWPATLPADQTTSGAVIQSTEVLQSPRGVHIVYAARAADGLPAPPFLNRLVIDFPPGGGLHTARFPRCWIARLQAKGPSACAPRSRIGSGAIVGKSELYPKGVDSTVRIFNGVAIGSTRRVLLIHVRPELGPDLVLVGKWRGTAREGLRLELLYPTIRILAGVPPEPSPTRISLNFGPRAGEVRYLRAPCHGVYEATAYYGDGSVVTSADRSRRG
jgi:hypothetical protein